MSIIMKSLNIGCIKKHSKNKDEICPGDQRKRCQQNLSWKQCRWEENSVLSLKHWKKINLKLYAQ
jgi:hypothetical protein